MSIWVIGSSRLTGDSEKPAKQGRWDSEFLVGAIVTLFPDAVYGFRDSHFDRYEAKIRDSIKKHYKKRIDWSQILRRELIDFISTQIPYNKSIIETEIMKTIQNHIKGDD